MSRRPTTAGHGLGANRPRPPPGLDPHVEVEAELVTQPRYVAGQAGLLASHDAGRVRREAEAAAGLEAARARLATASSEEIKAALDAAVAAPPAEVQARLRARKWP